MVSSKACGAGDTGTTRRAQVTRRRRSRRDRSCWLCGEGLAVEREVLGNGEDRTESPSPHSMASLARRGFSKERVQEVLKSGGKLSRGELLRCRVRCFRDRAAIGGKSFVERVFAACRDHFGVRRKEGSKKMRQDAGDLHAQRELRGPGGGMRRMVVSANADPEHRRIGRQTLEGECSPRFLSDRSWIHPLLESSDTRLPRGSQVR